MSRFNPEPPDTHSSHLHVAQLGSARRTRKLATAALVVALLAVAAWVTIPLGTVPVTLQVFVVVLAALLLSPGWAAAAMGVYVFMGAIGLPVYSAGTGGLGVLLGPTGGYILGFFLGAPLGAALRMKLRQHGVSVLVSDVSGAALCLGTIYLLGWWQLGVVMNMTPLGAFLAGVVPFIVPDMIKAAVAVSVATAIRRAR